MLLGTLLTARACCRRNTGVNLRHVMCTLCYSSNLNSWLQAFVYLAGIQLLASLSWRSTLAGGCGLLAGLAYQYNFLGLKRLKVHICCLSAGTTHPACPQFCPSAQSAIKWRKSDVCIQ